MGVNGGHGLTFRLCNLNFGQLVTIARFLHGDSGDDPPCIFVDSSWIARRFNGRSGGPISAIIDIAKCFTQEGFNVVIVCDGPIRHDSKRASVKHQSEREKARINGHMKRAELISKRSLLSAATTTTIERIEIRKEIEEQSKALEKIDSAQAQFYLVGQDFYEELKEKVSCLIYCGSLGSGKIRVIQSIFQADTTIARACVKKKCDIAFMNDSDLAAHAGKLCIGVAEFKLIKGPKKGTFTIDKTSIFSASKATIINICQEAIHFKAEVRTKTAGDKQKDPYMINAVHPIFDGVDDPKTRALYAVAAGCDVFPGGVFGVAAIRIMTAIKQQVGPDGRVDYDRMLIHFAEVHQKIKLPNANIDDVKSMLSAYVDAFLYEPANALEVYDDDDDDHNESSWGNNTLPLFIWNAPNSLPKFIESFSLNSSSIIKFPGPVIRVCKGI